MDYNLGNLMTYEELAETYGVDYMQVNYLINVKNKDKVFKANRDGEHLVSQKQFESMLESWMKTKRVSKKDLDTTPKTEIASNQKTIPMRTALLACGRTGHHTRPFFDKYAKVKTRVPMYLTEDEFEEMKADLLRQDEQMSIDEIQEPEAVEEPKSFTVDQVLEIIKEMETRFLNRK